MIRPFGHLQLASSSDVPPWIWVWMAGFLFHDLPELITALLTLPYTTGWTGGPVAWRIAAIGGVFGPTLQLAIPGLGLGLGLVLVALPGLRGRWVERHYRLAEPPADPSTALGEIIDYIQRAAPAALVRCYEPQTRRTAIVYPVGFRRAAVGVFGGLLRLWRTDRARAETIVLHEVAHLNQWDAFALGPGSLLEWVAKRWVWISGVMTLLPVGAALIIAWVADFTSFVTPRHGLMNLAAIAAHELSWLPILLVTAIGLTIAMFIHLIWCAGVFAPLIAAIWTAELSADRHAAARLGEAGTLLRSLKPPLEGHRLRKLLKTGLTHPPARLRRWLLRHPSQWRSLAVTLAVFPAGYLVQLALFVISFLVMDPRMRAPVGLAPAGAYQFGQPALNALIGGSHALAVGPFLIGGILLLLWPAMTQREAAPRPWLPYLLLAAPMLAAAFWGWTVPLEMGAPSSLSE